MQQKWRQFNTAFVSSLLGNGLDNGRGNRLWLSRMDLFYQFRIADKVKIYLRQPSKTVRQFHGGGYAGGLLQQSVFIPNSEIRREFLKLPIFSTMTKIH